MEVFEGTVRLKGDTGSLRALMLVADNRLKVTTSHHEIGDWQLSKLHSRIRPDGCLIVAEGEELIVSVAEPMRFAEAIGPSIANPGDGSLLGVNSPRDVHPLARFLRSTGSRIRAFPTAGKVTAGALASSAVLFLIAPAALLALTLFAGLAGLLVGGYGLLDPFTAVRLPERLSPPLLIRAGGTGLILAMVLAVLI